MQNVYLVRTAAAVSLVAVVLGVGSLRKQSDDVQIAPEAVAVSSARAEPAMHFPAGFALQASAHEPEVYEYY